MIPRLPGIEEYWEVLNSTVSEAIDAKATPQEALESAAEVWEAITDRLGREKQRQAYLRHLNLEE